MKSTFKCFAIIVVAAIIGFSMTACGGTGGGGNGPFPGTPPGPSPGPGADAEPGLVAPPGTDLRLGGQVYTQWYDDDIWEAGFDPFTGDIPSISSWSPGGAGEITGGVLDFTFSGSPDAADLWPIRDLFIHREGIITVEMGRLTIGGSWANLQVSDPDARGALLGLDSPDGELVKGYEAVVDAPGWVVGARQHTVLYIYVNAPVTITGTGRANEFEYDCEEWDGACYCEEYDGACYCGGIVITTRNINLPLLAGWNALYQITDVRISAVGNFYTWMSLYHAAPGPNSPVRWVLRGDYNTAYVAPIEATGLERPGRPSRWLRARR